MVKTAEVRDTCYLSDPLHRSTVWRVFGEGQVRTGLVVIIRVGDQYAAQMHFVENDQMAEALAADRSDNSFGMGVLSGTARRDGSVTDAHCTQTLLDWCSI